MRGQARLRPRFFYGWYIVASSMAANAILSAAYFQGFSAFFLPIENHFGWGRSAISAAAVAAPGGDGRAGPGGGLAGGPVQPAQTHRGGRHRLRGRTYRPRSGQQPRHLLFLLPADLARLVGGGARRYLADAHRALVSPQARAGYRPCGERPALRRPDGGGEHGADCRVRLAPHPHRLWRRRVDRRYGAWPGGARPSRGVRDAAGRRRAPDGAGDESDARAVAGGGAERRGGADAEAGAAQPCVLAAVVLSWAQCSS